MDYLLVKHKVGDYERWKQVFEGNGAAALESGLELLHVFRDKDEPNMVFVLCKVTDLEKAKAFTQPSEAQDSARRATVIGTPEGWWLSEAQAVWKKK